MILETILYFLIHLGAMFEELETIVLARDIEKYGLKKGDVGTVVALYNDKAVEVEFVTTNGKTIAVVTLALDDVRSTNRNEIFHVRGIVSLIN